MSDIIKLLPDHVANQIAAGEVIQRPASVVKELLENAIDAGSTQITLFIRDGGKTSIQVTDNGKGMSPTDARLCWERHATSKINAVEDIFKIRTMGFRGEALASVASVAMVELKTKRREDRIGTLIRVEGSEVKVQEETATTDGTSISVKNLFFNVPARRNFLKSDAVETRHIIDEFIRVALANPGIAFSMYANDNETYILKAGELNQRIRELFRLEAPQQILPVEEETTIVNVSGFIGKPEFAKKTRGEQFFFVNNRFIRDSYLNHALVSCYDQLIQKDQYPFYVLQIDIDPAQIDVNVHPTKTEIKFEDERAVYQIIRAVCKKAIGQFYHIPVYEPSSNDSFLTQGHEISRPAQTESSGQEYSPGGGGYTKLYEKPAKQDWQELFKVYQPETIGQVRKTASEEQQQLHFEELTQRRNIIQIHHTFLVVQVKSGLMLINQQAAHERILFEKFLQTAEKHAASQQRLFPKTIHVTASDETIVNELLPEFSKMGFELNPFGKESFVINAVPVELLQHDEKEMILSLIENYKSNSYAAFKPHERLARLLAEKLAIQPGKSLTEEEMLLLTDELFGCAEPQHAPDGKRCFRMLSLDELTLLFNG